MIDAAARLQLLDVLTHLLSGDLDWGEFSQYCECIKTSDPSVSDIAWLVWSLLDAEFPQNAKPLMICPVMCLARADRGLPSVAV